MTLLVSDISGDSEWCEIQSDDPWINHAPAIPLQSENNIDKAGEDYNSILSSLIPHIDSLKRYLRSRISIDDVDDVVQDVLLRIFRRVDLTALERPKCYLFQTAHATLIDRHRRQRTRKTAHHCELMDEMHPVDELHPLHILIARDEYRIVEGVLNKLPDRTREIIISVRIEGMSLKSLAQKYEISTSAIEKHVTKALRALQKAKSGHGFAEKSGISHSYCAA